MEFQVIAEILIKKSKLVKKSASNPSEDIVKYLILKVNTEFDENDYWYTLFFEPITAASYDEKFLAKLSFLVGDNIFDKIEIGKEFDVYRGTEQIGKAVIISKI
ncbi:MAG: hypothetical protein ACWA41_06535 [Putridiphycobacter sp.]